VLKCAEIFYDVKNSGKPTGGCFAEVFVTKSIYLYLHLIVTIICLTIRNWTFQNQLTAYAHNSGGHGTRYAHWQSLDWTVL
jgi:hypothetical protein